MKGTMSPSRPLIVGVALLSAAVLTSACHRQPAPESRIRSVVARIDGITCATCVPPLKASLRQQYREVRD